MPRPGEVSVPAGLAADRHPRGAAFGAVARLARLQALALLLALLRHHCPYVVWNWHAVAVVRSEPVRDQENHPAWPDGRPVAWSLKSGS